MAFSIPTSLLNALIASQIENGLLQRLHDGDNSALGELFSLHRQRLWRMVNFRLDRRLRGRVDADAGNARHRWPVHRRAAGALGAPDGFRRSD